MSNVTAKDDSLTPEQETELLDRHVHQLMETFDSVQIFASRNVGPKDHTRGPARGAGNWFARFGQVEEWVEYERESSRARCRKHHE